MKPHICCYMIGSMEFRTYEELKYEHFYVRSQLSLLGVDKIIDPLIKEKHRPGKKVTLTKCGIKPEQVYETDMRAVEESNILLWITGDVISEGSITEVATGGAWNRWKRTPPKLIIIVSPKRYHKKLVHFSNFHRGVKIVEGIDDALLIIKRRFKL